MTGFAPVAILVIDLTVNDHLCSTYMYIYTKSTFLMVDTLTTNFTIPLTLLVGVTGWR